MLRVRRVHLATGVAVASAYAALFLTVLAVRSTPTLAQSTNVPADVTAVLAKAGGSTPDDVPALQAGRVVVRTQVAPEHLEATVISAVKINTGLERTVSYFRQLVAYVDGQATMQYGVVAQPAVEADLKDLVLEIADVADLRACAPGRCDIRVGSADVDAVQSAVDWTATDAQTRATTWARRGLLAAINNYQRAGDAALRGYDEVGATLDLQTLWRALEQNAVIPATIAPGLQRYLGSYPGARPSEATNEFYFDKQHFTGLKPVLGVTHLVTWREPAEPQRVVVVQKQIQATHYFFGSLAVTLFVSDGATPPATFVVYTNQLRGDLLRGTQGSAQTGIRGRISNVNAALQRRLGEQLVRQSAETLMSSMKTALER